MSVTVHKPVSPIKELFLSIALVAGEVSDDTVREMKTCSLAKAQGYEVKILNLIETDCSDGWDVLGEVENDPEMAMELAATVISNTGGAKTVPFWNDAEMNILKAVILLKSVGEADISNRTGKKQTLGDVYRYVATRKLSYKEGCAESMEADFRFLREYMPTILPLRPSCNFKTQAMTFARRFCTAWRTACSSFRTTSSARCWAQKISTSSNREPRSVFITSVFPTRPQLILSSRRCFSRSCSSN